MHLTIWQTIFLALLQGVTELFPISSLGHSVLVPGLLPQLFPPTFATNTSCGGQNCFLPFVVALHLGTSLALVLYFWPDWFQVLLAIMRTIRQAEIRKDSQEWVGWLIIIGCIPGGLLGVALQGPLTQLFSSPVIAAAFLVVNGSVLGTAPDGQGVLVIEEHGVSRRGHKTAHAGKQYVANLGKRETGVVSVTSLSGPWG